MKNYEEAALNGTEEIGWEVWGEAGPWHLSLQIQNLKVFEEKSGVFIFFLCFLVFSKLGRKKWV